MKAPRDHRALTERVGQLVVRFQDGTAAVDDAAAKVLGLDKADLPALALLFFGGPLSKAALSERLDAPPAALRAGLGRLERAGYVCAVDGQQRLGLTPHARQWIATVWGPLHDDGVALCQRRTAEELAFVSSFMSAACRIQESHARRLEALLVAAESSAHSQGRGGLSPAALRRVEVFIEANLGERFRIGDLAERAGLSEAHFARAFKRTTMSTPWAYVEARRIAAAERWIRETDRPLAQIAVEVGLGTQSRLTTAFRRARGLTPARYRRQVR